MIRHLFIDNPILTKHVRSRLRPQPTAYLVIAVFLICCCLAWAGQAAEVLDEGFFFTIFFVIQGVSLQFAGTTQVAASTGMVNDSRILDFHRVSPLSPLTVAVGFVLGAPLREYLIATVVLPFTLLCAIIGPTGLTGFCTTGIVLLSSTLLFHTVAMTASLLAPPGKSRSSGMSVMALVFITAFMSPLVFQIGLPLPGLLSPIPTMIASVSDGGAGPGMSPTFFGLDLPIFVQSLIYQIPLTAFLMIAVVRRMRSAQAALYAKSTAIAFFVTITALNLGGVVSHPNLAPSIVLPAVLYIGVFLAIVLTTFVTPKQGAYMSCVRRSLRIGMERPPLWADDSSNRAVVLVFASLTYAAVQSIEALFPAQLAAGHPIRSTGIAICTILQFGFAGQFFSLKFGRRSRPVLVMYLFLFWVMPLLAGALCAATFNGPLGAMIGAVSPIFGIGNGHIVGLVSSALLAVLFFGVLFREENRIRSHVTETRAPWDEPESDGSPFLDN